MLGERQEDVWRWVRGVPDIGVEEGVVGATELLDAEVVVVDEALEGFAVKGHGDHGVAGLPTDGAVFGIVDYRPNARLGLDEGLISHLAHARGRMYSIVVVLGHEVIDGGVLIEIVGGVGLALGGGTVSDVVVIVGDLICGGQLIAGVVTILLVIDKNTATTKEGRSPL